MYNSRLSTYHCLFSNYSKSTRRREVFFVFFRCVRASAISADSNTNFENAISRLISRLMYDDGKTCARSFLIPPKSLLYLIETKNLCTIYIYIYYSLSVRYKRKKKKKENNLYISFITTIRNINGPFFPSFLRSYRNDKLYSILFRINRNYSFR